MSDPIKVLIVDDHPAMRIGLAAMLSGQPDLRIIGECGDAHSALAACAAAAPDVALVDLRLPDMGGAELTLEIRKRHPRTRVLVVTTFEADEDIYRAMHAGASGYLLKGAPAAELLAAIRAVHRGETVLAAGVAERFSQRALRKDLSDRELEVLRHLVGGLSNKEIASRLGVGNETIKTYLKNVFAKLGVADRTQAAIAALRDGVIHIE